MYLCKVYAMVILFGLHHVYTYVIMFANVYATITCKSICIRKRTCELMCVCLVCIYVVVYVRVYAFVYGYVGVNIDASVRLWLFVYACDRAYLCACRCLYVCTRVFFVHAFVNMYVYGCMHL